MRLENLPDGGHVKVIWSRERSRDCTRDKASRQRDSKMWWRRTTATLLGVSFGSYRRRRRDVQIGRGEYIPLRRLNDVALRRHWVFHLRLVWNVVETYWWDVVIMSPWDVITTYQSEVMKTYHWDVLVTCHWDVNGCFIWDLFETSWTLTDTTSSLRPQRRYHDIPIRSREDVPLRRLGDVPLRRQWVFYLRLVWDVVETYW